MSTKVTAIKPAPTETPKGRAFARFPVPDDPDKEKASTDLALNPMSGAAAVAVSYLKPTFGEQDMASLVATLTEQIEKLKGNDLSDCEALLFGQAQALHSMFVCLARRAINQEGLAQYEAHMRMALRAQNQSRMTLETLATIKNPPIFARQANIAAGHQQINNGSRARELETGQTKVLEMEDGQRLDARAQGTAGGTDPQLEAMGAINGTKVGRGQGPRIAERISRGSARDTKKASKITAGD